MDNERQPIEPYFSAYLEWADANSRPDALVAAAERFDTSRSLDGADGLQGGTSFVGDGAAAESSTLVRVGTAGLAMDTGRRDGGLVVGARRLGARWLGRRSAGLEVLEWLSP